MAGIGAGLSAFFASGAGEAATAAVASSAAGYGVSQLTKPKMPNINVPPPPGAAMISQQGQAAAAMTRARQASAGGLQSTITGAGAFGAGAAAGGPTSGAKSLTGQ